MRLRDARLENVTMEVLSTANCDSVDWAQRFAVSLSSQRTRMGEYFATKRQQLERVEIQLAQHSEMLTAELVRAGNELKQELDAARQREAALTAELTALRRDYQQVAAELAQLHEVETRGRETEPSSASTPIRGAIADREDFSRRYQSAMEDVRRLQAQNAELRQQLSMTQPEGPRPYAPPEGGLDWEAEKKRVLAALEAGEPGEGESARNDRLKIEEIIRTTDELVACKDQEIADLKHMLREQPCMMESVAVGAAALGQMLDENSIIHEQREILKRLQDEWREKLREAEVDISVQRATLARERAELEERLYMMENQTPKAAADASASRSDKPARGRWLSKLGLKDGGENVKPSKKG